MTPRVEDSSYKCYKAPKIKVENKFQSSKWKTISFDLICLRMYVHLYVENKLLNIYEVPGKCFI